MDLEPIAGVPEESLEWRFIRAGGPGGQNVNKVASAVQLRCDLKLCRLGETVKSRLRSLAGRRITNDDELVISAQRHRTQEQNRRDAWQRLHDLVTAARIEPKVRRPTKPSRAAKAKRRDDKSQRGAVKRLRSVVRSDD